ncbi:SDR family oxidoreductase [Paraferrimonas sedimenticola]|uniref:Short-chain dehydrogenase/reductase n=1 Tax=Paraferrimonas sedimenticola TaxID=375674 RepID=A0AA37W0X4_9GAMM|nr:SDR family oxidoreductase [Paraferrimonas sedimenticola]GLP96208.1 putative short-chain dehydrogenase/reductase [Paraferrimonas sedimenticola]
MSNSNNTSVIIITGASAGLGQEMARQFARLGYSLGLCARRLENLEALRQEIVKENPECDVQVRQLDVVDEPQVAVVFEEFRQHFGAINRVIVNAGIGKGVPIGNGGFNANRQTLMTNVVGALAQIEHAVAIFKQQNFGHLVCISSVSSTRGFPGTMNTYAASKAALSSLASGLQLELANTPIKVSCIMPGYIASDIATGSRSRPFSVATDVGVRSMVKAIEAEKASAYVPGWPWIPISFLLKHLPNAIAGRLIR